MPSKEHIEKMGSLIADNDSKGVKALMMGNPDFAASFNWKKIGVMLAKTGLSSGNEASKTFIELTGFNNLDFMLAPGKSDTGTEEAIKKIGVPTFSLSQYDVTPQKRADTLRALHDIFEHAKNGDADAIISAIKEKPYLISPEYAKKQSFDPEGDMKWLLPSEMRKDPSGKAPGMDDVFFCAAKNGQDKIVDMLLEFGIPHWKDRLDLDGMSAEKKKDILFKISDHSGRQGDQFAEAHIVEKLVQEGLFATGDAAKLAMRPNSISDGDISLSFTDEQEEQIPEQPTAAKVLRNINARKPSKNAQGKKHGI